LRTKLQRTSDATVGVGADWTSFHYEDEFAVPFKNRLKVALSGAFAVLLMSAGAAFAQNTANSPPPDPTGRWLVAKKVARIRIVNCDDRMWGIVSWEARPGIDDKNPDKGLSTRPTLGMPILLGMTPSKPDKWEGQIYNSENGKKYDASINLLDPGTLKVQGCVLGFLCGGENWSRVGPSDSEVVAQSRMPPPKGNPKPGAKQKLTKQQQAKQAAGKPSGMDAPPTSEVLESASAAEACSRISGLPGLAH
jgi:uncharacterized protein (DUF2147 family)